MTKPRRSPGLFLSSTPSPSYKKTDIGSEGTSLNRTVSAKGLHGGQQVDGELLWAGKVVNKFHLTKHSCSLYHVPFIILTLFKSHNNPRKKVPSLCPFYK